ncbi:hypothetical protein JCM10908_000700 [Rhodotorula pacifica]|uniref:YDG/SRA domain-containing protein n=1 Tax=Rhodotorula pacifica TaxID=1495444 RepID=UPI00316F9B6B
MPFDFAAFRNAQQNKNASLLTDLDIRGLKAVVEEHAPPSPVKQQETKKRAPKPKPAPLPRVSEVVEAAIKEREERGLRSSSRVKDKLLGVTPPPTSTPASYISDDEEEATYYEGGRKVRTGGGAYKKKLRAASKRIGKRTWDPKRYGSVPGVPCGTVFHSRMDASTASIHAPPVAGISTGKWLDKGAACVSICVSGGYVGDVDLGDRLTFSGAGGRDLSGTDKAPKNLRTAPQSSDQSWDNALNAALKRSVEVGKPIRLMRGLKNQGAYAPVAGYRYDGLYQAIRAWEDRSEDGFLICRVALVRLPGQPPLPVHPERAHLVTEADSAASTSMSEAASSALSRTSSSSTAQTDTTKATTPEAESDTSTDAPVAKRRRVSLRG